MIDLERLDKELRAAGCDIEGVDSEGNISWGKTQQTLIAE